MTKAKKIILGAVCGIVILLIALTMFLGHILKSAINNAGPAILGVPISVRDVNVGLVRGHFRVSGLVIGNPEGFKTPCAISLGNVTVDVQMSSLLAKVLVIDRIAVEAPEITYELGLKGSNIGAIQDRMGSGTGKDEEKPKSASEPKKVLIHDFSVKGGRIHLSTAGLGGHALLIPLPPVHLTEIGKESGGASVKEVISTLFSSIGNAVKGAASGIGKGVEAVGDGAKDAVKAMGAGAGKALESVGGLFKK